MSDSPRPLGPLVLVIVAALVALAVFWVGFMLAPAAVLLIFYLALSAGERGRHQREAEASRLELANGYEPRAGLRLDGAQARQQEQTGERSTVGNQPKGIGA